MGNLYNEINFNLPPTDPSNSTAIRRTIDGFVCPSNRKAAAAAATVAPQRLDGDMPAKIGPVRLPRQHGRRDGPAGSNPNCTTQDPTNPACCIYDNGVMYQNSAVSIADITDGTRTPC